MAGDDDKLVVADSADETAVEAAHPAGLEAGATGRASSKAIYARFFLAVLSALPWVGGFLAGAAARWSEREQEQRNQLFEKWLEEHENRLKDVGTTLDQIVDRVDGFSQDARDRVNTEAYLGLVRKGFRVWDRSETHEKRDFIRKLLTNAACDKLCDDDIVRLFIEWIDSYNEIHFKVMRAVYKNPRCTRRQIWHDIHGAPTRDDAAEADLFRLLIRDLSTGGVIRQPRQTDAYGNFLKQPRAKTRKGGGSRTTVSAFDDEKDYVLTELGVQFVHYTTEEVVQRIGPDAGEAR